MKQTTLLHIDASPRGGRSKSRQLGQDYISLWREAHPAGCVITRDVGVAPPPFVSAAWVEGAFAPATSQSSEARDAIAVSDAYVDELHSADHVVITTPIYNLSLPAALKAWIDQIVRVGRTFAVTEQGYAGLAGNKRVVVIVTSGGDPRPNTAGAAYNFLEPYVRAIMGFIGITDVRFVYAHSMSSETGGPRAFADAEAELSEYFRAA